jgi:hypothetical protein
MLLQSKNSVFLLRVLGLAFEYGFSKYSGNHLRCINRHTLPRQSNSLNLSQFCFSYNIYMSVESTQHFLSYFASFFYSFNSHSNNYYIKQRICQSPLSVAVSKCESRNLGVSGWSFVFTRTLFPLFSQSLRNVPSTELRRDPTTR